MLSQPFTYLSGAGSCRPNELSYSQSNSVERRDSNASSAGADNEGSGSGSSDSLTREQRNEKVLRYWEKKKRRKSQRFIRYECRKNLAEKRFRYQGRFVKFE